MKKKILSTIIAAQMILGIVGGTFAFAEERIYQTTFDLSPYFDVKAYLSQNNANTLDKISGNDYFIGNDAATGRGVALDVDDLSELMTDNILTSKTGIKYAMPLPDNKKGAVSQQWVQINLPEDYYSEFKILTYSDNTRQEKIYARKRRTGV